MDLIIIGVGHFGSALAQIYGRKGFCVHKIRDSQTKLDLSEALIRRSYVLLCVPTQTLPEIVKQRGDLLVKARSIIITAKGLVRKTGQTPSVFLDTHLKAKCPLYSLSGPSFASELKKGQPAALVLAGKNRRGVDALSELLSTSQLRLYKSYDPLGVELCGALKNIYALATGISSGLGFGDNTRAAVTTRALAEMSRIGLALGGRQLTIFGLAGAGDLFLTCSSRQSRNFQFGYGLAKGQKPEALLKKLGTVEGVWTATAAKRLCQKQGLRTPLIDTVVSILQGRLTPQEALITLMTRKVRHEFD